MFFKGRRFAATEPGDFSESELHSSRIDQWKAQLDVLKHVATLDSASLLVIFAMLEKVFPVAHHKGFVGISILAFLASLIGAGFASLSILASFPRKGASRMGREDRKDYLTVMLVTFLGFFFGLFCMAAFFALNWTW